MKAVHFGAGNIGRGFVGLLLHQSGYELVFADVAAHLIDALNAQPSYEVHEVGITGKTHVVDNYTAINSATDPAAVRAAIATADVITTAVGVRILEYIAPLIAQGLADRDPGVGPVAIMACENAIRATDILADDVRDHYTGTDLDAKVVFANTAVDRIVPNQDRDAGLTVTVEDFCEWVIEAPPFDGTPPAIDGVEFVEQLDPYIERKLFTVNTGHCATAWFGQWAGKELIADAIGDPEVYPKVSAVLAETARLIVAKYGFDPATHQQYVDRILQRFANRYLPDTVERVGRGPMRKLSRNDRFVSPAAQLAERSMDPTALVTAMTAGLSFHNDDDPEVAQLQQLLADLDPDQATEQITGLTRDDALWEPVRAMFATHMG